MRRQVISFLFTDIVDSTALFTSLGPDRADEVRRAHDRAVTRAVEVAGGTVVKHLGDGFMATFPGPSAACDAAIGAQRAVTRSGERDGVDLAIRAGISLGEATHEDGDWFGPPVVEAARLCAAAQPGEILIADRAAAMGNIAGGVTAVGALELKGLDQPVPASRVAWVTASDQVIPLPAALRVGSGLPFVGRIEQRRQLDERLKEALAGRGGIVLVAGEPGIGKSRLVTELAASAHAEGVTVSYGRCDQDALFPYQPFAEALRHLHSNGVVPASRGIELLLPDIGDAPTMDPDRARSLVLDATRSALRDAAADRPLVLVFDDLHWADAATVAMLRHLLRELGDTPLLVVGTYRDTDIDRTHPFGTLLGELRREKQVERIHLTGIDDGEIYTLLGALARHDLGEDARQLARLLATETSGNPFFVGEVLAHLTESGALVNDDGRWSAAVDLATVGLPEGVRDVVGQRLSRLSPDTNAVLAVVAVNGRPIDLSLLRDAWDGSPEDTVTAIDEAVGAGLLVEETSRRSPHYSFSHALVRQTLLDELTSARTLRIHARLAEVLATKAQDLPDRWLEAVHHAIEGAPLLGFARAGEILDAADTTFVQLAAPETLVAVAQRFDAVGRELGAPPSGAWCASLNHAARASFQLGDRALVRDLTQRAIEMARELEDPRLFVAAVTERGHSAGFGLDPEFLALLPEALELSVAGTPERIGLLGQRLNVATYLGIVDVDAAGSELMDEAERTGLDGLIAGAHSLVAASCQAALPATRALHHADCALALADTVSRWTVIHTRFVRIYPLIRLGRSAEARENAGVLAADARKLGTSIMEAAAHQQLAILDMADGELASARHHIDEVGRLSPGEPMFEIGCLAQQMWLAHLEGDHHGALDQVARLGELPYPELMTAMHGWLAGAAGDNDASAVATGELAAIDLSALPTTWVTPGLWMVAAELAVRHRHAGLAAQILPLLERLSGEMVIFVCNFVVGSADEALADLRELLR